jgi:uncharacterized membrane protein
MRELKDKPSVSQLPTKTTVLGLDQNVAGLLCYIPIPLIGLVSSLVWLGTEPKSNRFVRFHAFQSLALTAVSLVTFFVLGVFRMIGLGFISSLLSPIISVVLLATFVICMIQAGKNEMYKLPIVGDFAIEQA